MLRVARNVESKNLAMATRRTTPNIYRENNVLSYKPLQPTRLKPQQLEEIKSNRLFFICDNKYNKVHKCGEKKLFYIDCEEEEEEEPSQDENVNAIYFEELTPRYCVMHWLELSLLKPSISKDISKRKR